MTETIGSIGTKTKITLGFLATLIGVAVMCTQMMAAHVDTSVGDLAEAVDKKQVEQDGAIVANGTQIAEMRRELSSVGSAIKGLERNVASNSLEIAEFRASVRDILQAIGRLQGTVEAIGRARAVPGGGDD